MLQELKSLSKQLNWIGLSVKANHIDLIVRSIAGDNHVDGEIELAVSELVRTVMPYKLGSIKDEMTELLMLHSDYTKFLDESLTVRCDDGFAVLNAEGVVLAKSASSPEEAVALHLITQSP